MALNAEVSFTWIGHGTRKVRGALRIAKATKPTCKSAGYQPRGHTLTLTTGR
jgi:hypothetical protein